LAKSYCFLLVLLSCTVAASETQPRKPPHIFFVLIDDLGWGNIGYHVQQSSMDRQREVQTPVMDHLAKVEGLELNRHYVGLKAVLFIVIIHDSNSNVSRFFCCIQTSLLSKVHHSCTGTRTSLQSGRFPVHVQTLLKNPEEPSSGTHRTSHAVQVGHRLESNKFVNMVTL
jgi:hypothetical protein